MTSAAVVAVTADGRREPARLGGEINRGGASGRIDAIAGDPDRVAKIYHDPAKAAAARDRLLAMLARPPSLRPPRLTGVDYVQLAWPDALIEDGAGRLLGFRMPRVALDRAAPLECLLHPAQRRAEQLPEDYGLRVFAAANLASVVAELHRLGHYVIDLKPLNFYVYRETMFIAVLDCDGFSIAGPQRRFPASHFSDEYRCPESAGRRPEDLGEEQDLFALAVIIFQLLNDGIHPFDGHPAPGASVPSSHQEKINAGLYPYGRRRHSPLLPHTLSLYAALEDEAQRLFDRAFTAAASSRPSAAEWRDHLRGLIEGRVLVRCTKNGDHAHFGKGCGLCLKEAAIRAAASRPPVVPRARRGAPAVLGRRPRPAISPAARPAPLAPARSARPVAARPAAVSTGAVGGLAAALVTATKAGIVGGAIGLAAVLLALPLLTAAEALLLTIIIILAIGVWLDDRRGHGYHRGLTAALISLVPTWATFPALYTAALGLPAPAALAVTAALASLVPGFTFRYLLAGRQRVARRWSSTVRRGAVGAAVIAGLVAVQVAATVALGVVEAGLHADRPALPHPVVAAVGRAKQSIADAVDRVKQSVPPR